MKNNYKIIIGIVAIVFLMTIAIFSFNFESSEYNEDLKIFNELNQENLDLNICENIENLQIKEKCIDNYYSIKAFDELDKSLCKKIKSAELKIACEETILKFKN